MVTYVDNSETDLRVKCTVAFPLLQQEYCRSAVRRQSFLGTLWFPCHLLINSLKEKEKVEQMSLLWNMGVDNES